MKLGSISTSDTEPVTCPHCGAQLQQFYAAFNDRSFPVFTAPCTCEGARAERMERMEQEQAYESAMRRKAMKRSGIPRRFWGVPCLDGWRDGAYLFGNVGTGKTWTAVGLAKQAIIDGANVRFMAGGTFLDAFKASYNGDHTTLNAMKNCGLLILDDLGKESPSAWAVSSLFNVIDHRYNLGKPVIITSNYPLNRLGARLSNGDSVTSAAIVSRLYEMCPRMELSGCDRRLDDGEV